MFVSGEFIFYGFWSKPKLIFVKHTEMFANMKVLVVLVIRLHSQEEYKEDRIIALSADKLPRSQECGREGDEGLLTGEKIRGREIKDQGEKLPGRADPLQESLAGVGCKFSSTG